MARQGRWVGGRPSAAGGAAGGVGGEDRPYREVRLDLGCGKGVFAVGSALADPGVLFAGVDADPVCVAVAARLAHDAGAANAVFTSCPDGRLAQCFAPSELSRIYINFPTPHPRGREAHLRLTHAGRLGVYRALLAAGGTLYVRTDNRAFLIWTLGQLDCAGYEVLRCSWDARAEMSLVPEGPYERRAVEAGARICALVATPVLGKSSGATPHAAGAAVSDVGGTEKGNARPMAIDFLSAGAHALAADRHAFGIASAMGATSGGSDSLYDYLSSDELDDPSAYVPPEMARAVAAIRKTREQMRRKGTL